MARYAEWNKFIGNLKTDKYGATNVNEVGIAFEKATADVVPKTEIAREIFEEIEKLTPKKFTEKSQDFEFGYALAIQQIKNKIAELKKKYTENENG